MTDILNKTIVLVLNRNWQAINIRTPQDVFCQLATNAATALDIEGENQRRGATLGDRESNITTLKELYSGGGARLCLQDHPQVGEATDEPAREDAHPAGCQGAAAGATHTAALRKRDATRVGVVEI